MVDFVQSYFDTLLRYVLSVTFCGAVVMKVMDQKTLPGDKVFDNPIWRPVFALEVAYASEFVCLRTTTQDIEL